MVTFIPAIRRLAVNVDDALRGLAEATRHPYRRERHYMRGPGPKWHTKHDQKADGRVEKGPMTRALDLLAELYETMVEARASQALLEAKLLRSRYHISPKGNNDLPIVR